MRLNFVKYAMWKYIHTIYTIMNEYTRVHNPNNCASIHSNYNNDKSVSKTVEIRLVWIDVRALRRAGVGKPMRVRVCI